MMTGAVFSIPPGHFTQKIYENIILTFNDMKHIRNIRKQANNILFTAHLIRSANIRKLV